MPLAVEDTGAFAVTGALERGLHAAFELCEEDEVFGPVVEGCLGGGDVCWSAVAARLGGEDALAVLEGEGRVAGHVVFEVEGGTEVEEVGFVDVNGFFGGSHV